MRTDETETTTPGADEVATRLSRRALLRWGVLASAGALLALAACGEGDEDEDDEDDD